jgi:hypothetical protein
VTAPRAFLAAALAALAACGPYVNVAEKLDVTVPITDGETWIAANADGTDVRLLIVPDSAAGVPAAFSLASALFPMSEGTAVAMLQGEWVDHGATATIRVRREYSLPDESGKNPFGRTGSTRKDVDRAVEVTLSRPGGELVIGGDPSFAGSYVRFRDAAAALGTTTERDAACAFQIGNLAMRATHVRILGFGGPAMTQYQTAATFVGTLGGTFQVFLQGFLNSTTTFTFVGLEELGGTHLEGVQTTNADSSGDGYMSGTLTFRIVPRGPGGADLPPIVATLDFGGGSDPGDRVTITAGNASGGHYVSTLEGGGIARVSPVTPPVPSLTDCLALP